MIGALLDALLDSAVRGAGFGAGYNWADQKMNPEPVRPIWNGTIGNVTFIVSAQRIRGAIRYDLDIIADGRTDRAGSWYEYPQVVAAMQQWQTFLNNGGKVADWRRRNALPGGGS
jgi:hypothetical protein